MAHPCTMSSDALHLGALFPFFFVSAPKKARHAINGVAQEKTLFSSLLFLPSLLWSSDRQM